MRVLKQLKLYLLLLALLACFTPPPAGAALLMTNEGEAKSLAVVLGRDAQEVLSVHLYTDDRSPAETDTAASYTEAVGGGYAPVNLTPASWTITPNAVGGAAQAVYPQIVWTFTGPLTGASGIYGYFVKGNTSGIVYWSERTRDTGLPYIPAKNGDVYRGTIRDTQE